MHFLIPSHIHTPYDASAAGNFWRFYQMILKSSVNAILVCVGKGYKNEITSITVQIKVDMISVFLRIH